MRIYKVQKRGNNFKHNKSQTNCILAQLNHAMKNALHATEIGGCDGKIGLCRSYVCLMERRESIKI